MGRSSPSEPESRPQLPADPSAPGDGPRPEAAWRRRPERRPDEILDAALLEFEEKGFDAARMEDIAARAGLSKAGVYLYFDSKSAVLEALIRRDIAPIARLVEQAANLGVADPIEAIRQIYRIAPLRLTQPGVFAIPRLVVALSRRFPQIAETYRDQVIDRIEAAVRRLIEAGVASGMFNPVSTDAAVRMIAGPIVFEAMRRNVLGVGLETDIGTSMAEQAELVLTALRRDRRQP